MDDNYKNRITKEDTEHAGSINPPAPQHLPPPPNPYAGSINPPAPRLLKQKEVAEIIRKSEAWLERKRWEGGGIPFRKMGRGVLYYEADVLDWIRKHPPLTSTSKADEGDE
jgi:hypothetical protein